MATYDDLNLAIAFTDTKQAALYFEDVIPLGLLREEERDDTLRRDSLREETLLLVRQRTVDRLMVDPRFDHITSHARSMLMMAHDFPEDVIEYNMWILSAYMAEKSLAYSFWCSPHHRVFEGPSPFKDLMQRGIAPPITAALPPSQDAEQVRAESTIVCALHDLNVVDTRHVTWEHIFEFRRDRESQRKLRDLRLFLFTSYADKPATYIRDDIQRRIDEHNVVIRQWGFTNASGIFSALLSWKSVEATTLGVLAAALAGGPLPIILGAGIAMNLGVVSLDIASRLTEREKLRRLNPVTYLAELKKSVGAAN